MITHYLVKNFDWFALWDCDYWYV